MNTADLIHPPDDELLARDCALEIRHRFADYHTRFRAITQRAKRRFEQRQWAAARLDSVERIELYDLCAGETTAWLETTLDTRVTERDLWARIFRNYSELIAALLDQEMNKTFFNTLTRRFFKTRGVDAAIEFVALDIEPTDAITHPVARHNYIATQDLVALFRRALEDYPFAVAFADAEVCAQRVALAVTRRIGHWGVEPVRALELLETVFYRERRAYLVGRIFGDERFAPFVMALVHDEQGIRVDAVLTERDHVAILFGVTRAYFQADLATVGDAVVFLRTLLPRKPIDELYTVLGRAKQGKTERYRHFFHYLDMHADECFVHADGERGMVMAVFTLPSYPLVFKLIRDRFAYPKEMLRQDVMDKYQLVFKHDRIGRLVDAQEFRHLRFQRAQFAPAVLDELLTSCRDSVIEDGDEIILIHMYVERRLRPLNLFVREAPMHLVRTAVLDYGQAIKDLAASNIFPGDLLLKNFGVTRHGRAIFYDYDELCLLSECRFRAMPQARDESDETVAAGDWVYVGQSDVFPEQFLRFLGLSEPLREALMETHGEIFDVRWWLAQQERVKQGVYADLPPYVDACRVARS